MKKLKRNLLVCLMLALMSVLCVAFVACAPGGIRLTFETNGGAPIEAISVEKGEQVTLPTPEREGYVFDGWFENDDFSGEAISSVVASESKTYYAKWTKNYAVTLDVGAGQLSAPEIHLKAGENIFAAVEGYVPTRPGWQFGEWLMNGASLSPSAKMPESDVTLTARYKVGYTVHVWLQNADLNGFEQGEDIVGYDYPVANYMPEVTVNGYEVTEHEGEVKSGPLTEDPASNVFTFYLERGKYQVTLFSNYPAGMDDEVVTIDFTYGQEVVLPYDRFHADGYLLMGWSRNKDDTVDYPSQAIDGLLRNGDGVKREDTVTLSDSEILYAIWSKGYADLVGGEDIIFQLESDPEHVILLRHGFYYQGQYNANAHSFSFALEDDTLNGKFVYDGFVYYDELRDGRMYYQYVVGEGIYGNVTLRLDAYNGATLDQQGAGQSTGTYYIDDDGFYRVTYTTGQAEGEACYLLGYVQLQDGSQIRVFLERNESEVEYGEMWRYAISPLTTGTINEGDVVHYIYYQITLDGFGNASMITDTGTANYIYRVLEDELLLYSASNGRLAGTFKLVDLGSGLGYISYDATLDNTYTDANGATLTLDGACNATYSDSGSTETGHYVLSGSSVLGGSLVTFFGNNHTKRLFRVYSTADSLVFEEKKLGYAEYYYKDETSTYYTPMLVIDDAEAGLASLYGYTSQRTYVKVAEGNVVLSDTTGLYQFTVNKRFETEEELVGPIDVLNVKSFIYSTGVASDYNVTYWYSVTYVEGDPETSEFDEQYTGEGNATLTLVGGFAVYKDADGTIVAGVYNTVTDHENVIRVTGDTGYLYFELDESGKTFLLLEKFFGTISERTAAGVADRSVQLSFDGKGGATLTTTPAAEEGEESVPVVVEGTYEEKPSTEEGAPTVYTFKASDNSLQFDFMILSTSSASYFSRFNQDIATELTSEKDGELTLDGFSYQAVYVDADGNEVTGRYIVSAENEIQFTGEEVSHIFDVKGATFTLRGAEARTYLYFNNQEFGCSFELDGYGHVTVYDVVDGERVTVGRGTYRLEDGECILEYEGDKGTTKLTGVLGIYAVTTTTGYYVFIVEQEEIVRNYVNEADWSVLIPDGRGSATMYTKTGALERGTYIIITEDLLYYVNNAGTDASIYRYDNEKGTIERLSYSEHGYYTPDLRSLRFSRYGFMIMDGETRYYYTLDSKGEITVYLRDSKNENANEYGFVSKNIGRFEETIYFEGTTYIDNDGWAIEFGREEATKNDYPVLTEKDNSEVEKVPLGSLTFQPSGAEEFSVRGSVVMEGIASPVPCTVVRELVGEGEDEKSVLYVLIGTYRFDIEVTYKGETGNSYKVTSLRRMASYVNDAYYNDYYLLSMLMQLFGGGTPNLNTNDYGYITISAEYDTKGDVVERYIDVTFGIVPVTFDDGTQITSFEHVGYEFDERFGYYVVNYTDSEENAYKFYFLITENSYFDTDSFVLASCARVQTLESDGYEITVERTIAGQSAGVGYVWNVALKEGDAELTFDSLAVFQGKVYFIVRTREHLESDAAGVNSGRILTTTYYVLNFVDRAPEQVGGADDADPGEGGEGTEETPEQTTVPFFESVTVEKVEMVTVYDLSGSYVDISKTDDKIYSVYYGRRQYYVDSDGDKHETGSNLHTVTTTSGMVFEVTITEEEDGTLSANVTRRN